MGFPPLLVDSESQHETNEIVSPHLEHGPGNCPSVMTTLLKEVRLGFARTQNKMQTAIPANK